MLEAIAIDTHTHTVLSGHAWSTLRENAVAAVKKGLYGFCLTEHGHSIPGAGPFFLAAAQKMLPPVVEGIQVYYGIEANIMDMTGALDIPDKALFDTEFCVASMHDLCMQPGDEAENTVAYISVLAHPAVDILGHIDDRRTPSDFDVVITEAARMGKLIEINNNSMLMRKGSRERVRKIAETCAKHNTRVCVSSDAHFDAMIGDVGPSLKMLGEIGFPDSLIVNRSKNAFQAYLGERTARLDREVVKYPTVALSSRRMRARPV